MRNGDYILVKAPDQYPGKTYRGHLRYVYEHHLVWWRETSHVLAEGDVIHHKNEDKHDNRFENLEMKSRANHSRDHVVPCSVLALKCSLCGERFLRPERILRAKKKAGQTLFYCSRSCGAKGGWSNSSPPAGPEQSDCVKRGPPLHGSYGRYRKGCRCDDCRDANATRQARYRKKRRQSLGFD